jgi:hypothetical protein
LLEFFAEPFLQVRFLERPDGVVPHQRAHDVAAPMLRTPQPASVVIVAYTASTTATTPRPKRRATQSGIHAGTGGSVNV